MGEGLLVAAVVLAGIAAVAAVVALVKVSRAAASVPLGSDAHSAGEVSAMLERQFAQSRELQRADLERASAGVEALSEQMAQLRAQTARSLETVRADNAECLERVRQDTARSMEAVRSTVDEKLGRTLGERLEQSFSRVDERLSRVDRGLGEMQGLAAGVGDLKRVLSNVKTRGIMGEVQLGAILREVLAPSQYAQNVATRPGSSERVEFAVRIPADDGSAVWLPIDAKFPGDAYEHLREAQDAGDAAAVEAAWKTLELRLRGEAKDINAKYVAPPATTTFGILFLPFEGLYAEVVSRPGLLERLQRESHVTVAGPSTMAALLSSLEMSFQAVAIRRRADEIQTVLAEVKTEFGKYGEELERVRRQLATASKTLDALAGTRTRAMDKVLACVTLPGNGEETDALRSSPATSEKPARPARTGAHFAE